jgi:hypothetical protein
VDANPHLKGRLVFIFTELVPRTSEVLLHGAPIGEIYVNTCTLIIELRLYGVGNARIHVVT